MVLYKLLKFSIELGKVSFEVRMLYMEIYNFRKFRFRPTNFLKQIVNFWLNVFKNAPKTVNNTIKNFILKLNINTLSNTYFGIKFASVIQPALLQLIRDHPLPQLPACFALFFVLSVFLIYPNYNFSTHWQ